VRVAIIVDFLCQRGGSERFALHVARLLPGATIATSLWCPERTYREFLDLDVQAELVVSAAEADRFRRRVLRYPSSFERMELSWADLVVVSTAAFAHHVRHEATVVYWHAAPRFLYDPNAYLGSPLLAKAATLALGPLRRADRRAARRHRLHLANSAKTAARLRRTYGLEAAVLHPPLVREQLGDALAPMPAEPRALVVSRLLRYKHVDVVIEACRLVGVPLTVVGRGPAARALRKRAPGSVTFLEDVDDEHLAALYASHSVVLCPGEEDFGLVPLEANWCGRPVLVSIEAGAAEVMAGRLGALLVDEPDPVLWAIRLVEALQRNWDPRELRASTWGIGPERFDEAFLGFIERHTPFLLRRS
jgi:glycosyltransferase involved in cell wall biosynthesis